ncbi:hypothetical protein PPYR_04964 [Photinus pyralis]|uniref:RING-type E3 ubiquitin transferase n=1 Tax=Photinus pyralis TaxID=7054 RepID=A0A5N4AZU2_PHOPY|nr:peroxisome biogenesis factor 10-like [Photinus pyralis]KAB0802778.1 hypothetical protein PPYR_04964 [Photinus pyralis]
MHLYDAKVADILRCAQRDDSFVKSCEEDVLSIFKLLGFKNYNHLKNTVPAITNIWYYYFTSLNKLQTLGEEYTGVIRFTDKNNIPSKFVQVLWILFYIGGESLYNRFLDKLKTNINNSETLTNHARLKLIRVITFFKENKLLLLRLHYSLFYIYGKYYNLSNRIWGIKYILLRQWLQDDSSTLSFNILGKVSLAYLVYALIRGMYLSKDEVEETAISNYSSSSTLCSLCTEPRKDTCATSCGHLFCWKCIYESLNYQQFCPICREIIHPSRIIFLQNCE